MNLEAFCQIAFQKVVPAHAIRDELLGVGINFSTRPGVCCVHHPHLSFVHCSVSPPLLGSWCTSKSAWALWVIKILHHCAAFASHIYPETHLRWKENAGEIQEALTHTASLRLRKALQGQQMLLPVFLGTATPIHYMLPRATVALQPRDWV